MSAERLPRRPAPLRLAGSERDDAISAALGALEGALRLPEGEAAAIRDELESHLRERVRDLEIAGMTEDDAARCAAGELGDIPHLARRYREARAFPRRRLIMNLSVLAIAGAAVVVGVVTLTPPGVDSRVSVFTPPATPPRTAPEQAALSRTMQAEFQDVPVRDVFMSVSQAIDMPVNVVWSSLPHVKADFKVSFVDKNADFAAVIAEVGEDIGSGTDWTLAYRVTDGAIRVASQDYFDRREMVLASYDLSAFSDRVSNDQLAGLLGEFVYPDGWKNNGGDLARVEFAGDRMFIEAPKRYHVQIQWFIDELSKGAGAAALPVHGNTGREPKGETAR